MAFARSIACVVDRTLVNGSAAAFPVPFAFTIADLRTVANGGVVVSGATNSPKDIRFFSDVGLTTPLTYQISKYVPSTGLLIGHVLVPVDSAINTLFWMGAGDASISTDASSTAVWDSNFLGVYLFGDGTTLNVNDYGQSGNHLTNNGGVTATGFLSGAIALNGTSQYAEKLSPSGWSNSLGTIQAMFKPSATFSGTICVGGANNAASASAGMELSGRPTDAMRATNGAVSGPQSANATVTTNAWNSSHAVILSNTSRKLLVNGGSILADTSASTTPQTPTNMVAGARHQSGGYGFYFAGAISVLLFSNTARADSWIRTQDNAWNNLATFCTAAGSTPPVTVNINTRPESFLQGQFGYLQAEYLSGGSRNTSFTSAMTLSKVSGPGSLTGTLNPNAVLGVATFSAWGVSVAGAYVLKVTTPTGEFVNTIPVYVRAANPYAAAGTWSALRDIYAPVTGRRIAYKVYIPAGATSATAKTTVIHSSDSGNFGFDPDPLIAKPGLQWVATDDWIQFAIPQEAGGAVYEQTWREAWPLILDREEADGVEMNRDRLHFYGFSGAAQKMLPALYQQGSLLASAVIIDGTLDGVRLTATIGPPLGVMSASFLDPSGVDTPQPANEFAAVVKASGVSMMWHHGNQTAPSGVRDIAILDIWRNAIDALSGPDFEYYTASNTTIGITGPTVKYFHGRYNNSGGISHANMEILIGNSTNHPIVKAWIDAQSRSGAVSAAPILLHYQRQLQQAA